MEGEEMNDDHDEINNNDDDDDDDDEMEKDVKGMKKRKMIERASFSSARPGGKKNWGPIRPR